MIKQAFFYFFIKYLDLIYKKPEIKLIITLISILVSFIVVAEFICRLSIKTLLVVNKMLNVMGYTTITPRIIPKLNRLIYIRCVIIYTADIIHRIIFLQLTSLLKALSQIDKWIFKNKKLLMSCTLGFCFFYQQARAKE